MKATTKPRLSLISWIFIPLIIFWLTTSYLLGLTQKVNWQSNSPPNLNILGASDTHPTQKVDWRRGLVTLWFDDAWYSQYAQGFPILESYGVKGALSVATDLVGGNDYMTYPQIDKLQHYGWQIFSHSVSHQCQIDKLNDQKIESELTQSKKILQSHNLNIDGFVTPCGAENQKISQVARENYSLLRSTVGGLNKLPVDDPYSLRIQAMRNTTTMADINSWLAEASAKKEWLIIVFHLIGDKQSEYETTPTMVRLIIESVEKQKVPLVLPYQALSVY